MSAPCTVPSPPLSTSTSISRRASSASAGAERRARAPSRPETTSVRRRSSSATRAASRASGAPLAGCSGRRSAPTNLRSRGIWDRALDLPGGGGTRSSRSPRRAAAPRSALAASSDVASAQIRRGRAPNQYSIRTSRGRASSGSIESCAAPIATSPASAPPIGRSRCGSGGPSPSARQSSSATASGRSVRSSPLRVAPAEPAPLGAVHEPLVDQERCAARREAVHIDALHQALPTPARACCACAPGRPRAPEELQRGPACPCAKPPPR